MVTVSRITQGLLTVRVQNKVWGDHSCHFCRAHDVAAWIWVGQHCTWSYSKLIPDCRPWPWGFTLACL